MKNFEYLEPKTIKEACSFLYQYKKEAKLFAGFTDLIVQMKENKINPSYLINLKSIPGLDYINYSQKEGLKIGALTNIRSIETSSIIKEKYGLLAKAAYQIGSVQVRNRGTIGGNLCNASPSADTAPSLICLAARAKIAGLTGERFIDLENFFTGPGETVLQTGEILTEILIPNLPSYSGGVYLKHTIRRAMDLAIVGVAVVITLNSRDGICRDIKITLGAVAPTPIRVRNAEEILRERSIEEKLIEEVAQTASDEARPITDIRGSARYRREMVKVLTRRATTLALELAKSG